MKLEFSHSDTNDNSTFIILRYRYHEELERVRTFSFSARRSHIYLVHTPASMMRLSVWWALNKYVFSQ